MVLRWRAAMILTELGFIPTFVCVQVFESANMMDLNLTGHRGCPTVFAYLSQKPLFEFGSVMPDWLGLVIQRCLDIPFQGDTSPGCYQWLLSLTGNGDLQCLVGLAISFDPASVFPVDVCYCGVVLGR
jgi:hypothetical protein